MALHFHRTAERRRVPYRLAPDPDYTRCTVLRLSGRDPTTGLCQRVSRSSWKALPLNISQIKPNMTDTTFSTHPRYFKNAKWWDNLPQTVQDRLKDTGFDENWIATEVHKLGHTIYNYAVNLKTVLRHFESFRIKPSYVDGLEIIRTSICGIQTIERFTQSKSFSNYRLCSKIHLMANFRDTVEIGHRHCIVKPHTSRGIDSLRYMYIRYTEIISTCLPIVGSGIEQAIPQFEVHWTTPFTSWDEEEEDEALDVDGPILGAAMEFADKEKTIQQLKSKRSKRLPDGAAKKKAKPMALLGSEPSSED